MSKCSIQNSDPFLFLVSFLLPPFRHSRWCLRFERRRMGNLHDPLPVGHARHVVQQTTAPRQRERRLQRRAFVGGGVGIGQLGNFQTSVRGQRCVKFLFFLLLCMLTLFTILCLMFEYPIQNKEGWFLGFVLTKKNPIVYFSSLSNLCLPFLSTPMNHHDHRCYTDRGAGAQLPRDECSVQRGREVHLHGGGTGPVDDAMAGHFC